MAAVEEGEVLAGKYRVERVLGEGGMGVVVAAIHLALDERVALKFMRAEAMDREGGVQRFVREARAAVKLKSEHVARVLDVGTLETGSPYIVMEYLEGSDLAQVFAARRTLPPEEAVDYLLQACDAIVEAHAYGIVHRDLKPANLFIARGRDGSSLVKVLDFGISKFNPLGDRPASMTSSAMLLGSPAYMSPEQMKSSRDVGPATDIWSLGVILYEALAGRLPFLEPTMGSLMAKVLTERAPLDALAERAPVGLVAVVERCLEKEPERRYPNITELVLDLAPFAPVSSADLVSRIVAMGRASFRTQVVTPLSSLSPMAATQHSSILGVATTQVTTGSLSAPAGRPSRHRGLFAALVLGGLGVTAALIGTRTWRSKSSDTISSQTSPESAGKTEVAPAAPPPAASAGTSGEIETEPAPSVSPSASSSPPSARPSVAIPAAPRATPSSSASASHPSHPADAGDPFGNSRY